MRKLPLIAAFLLAGTAAQAAPDREAELERALAGRLAGEPVPCIDLHRVTSSRVITGTAILYRVGGTIYVNRPEAGAESLNRRDTQINRMFGTNRLCNVDTVTMVDLVSGTFTGVVFLGDFVPYRRVETGAAD